jgi:hypothetical protein
MISHCNLQNIVLTGKHFVVPILSLELHLGAVVEILDMAFVLSHPLENSKFHVIFSFTPHFDKVFESNSPFQKFQIIVFVHPILAEVNEKNN